MTRQEKIMSAYDDMLNAVEEMAATVYHYPRNEVHDILNEHLKALLEEVSTRLEVLGALEISGKATIGVERMRALGWSLAAAEVRTFVEAGFTFEPSQDKPREVSFTTEECRAALEYFSMTDSLTPDYAYNPETDTLLPLSARAKYATRPAEGYRHTLWAPGPSLPDDHVQRRLVDFGERLYTARKELGWSRKKLARKIPAAKEVVRSLEYVEPDLWEWQMEHVEKLAQDFASAMKLPVSELWPETL